MTSYTLMIDKNDKEMSWAFIPNDLWLIILRGFLAQEANRIALAGISKLDDAPTHERFPKLKQKHLRDCELKWNWELASGKVIKSIYSLALFHYDKSLQEQFENVEFRQWNLTSDSFPYEKLFFFRDEQIILQADSLESILMFPKLSTNQVALLKSLDTRIAPNLHSFRQDEITLSYIERD
jgi:hypothetical protein